MAAIPDPIEPECNTDPAVLAFEMLREEVALARRAVAGLAAERASIEIPDYSETLGKIMRASTAAAATLKLLNQLPILNTTTQDWARAIEQLSEPTRRADRQVLANAHEQLRQVAVNMSANLRSAQTAEAQHRCLLWTFAGGVVAGALLSVLTIVFVNQHAILTPHWFSSSHGAGYLTTATAL